MNLTLNSIKIFALALSLLVISNAACQADDPNIQLSQDPQATPAQPDLQLDAPPFVPATTGTVTLTTPDVFPKSPAQSVGVVAAATSSGRASSVNTVAQIRNQMMSLAGQYLEDNRETLLGGLNPSTDLTLVNGPHLSESQLGTHAVTYLKYQQILDTLPVETAFINLGIELSSDNTLKVIDVEQNLLPQVSGLATTPLLNQEEARRAAARRLNLPEATPSASAQAKVMFINERWQRTWQFTFTKVRRVAVAVAADGAVTAWENVFYAFKGRVLGRGVQFNPADNEGQNLDTLSLGHLRIERKEDHAEFFSDYNGNFTVETPPEGPSSFGFELRGRFVTVWTSAYVDGEFSYLIPDARFAQIEPLEAPPDVDRTVTFNNEDNSICSNANNVEPCVAMVNAYRHTTIIHDWLAARLPGGGVPLNIPISVYVNHLSGRIASDGSAHAPGDAYFDRGDTSLNFFVRSGPITLSTGHVRTYRNTAYDTWIYHEYGHFADHVYGEVPLSTEATGLGEGWGDIVATFHSGQPVFGEARFVEDPNSFERTADNDYQYPQDGTDEIHELGKAWAGFAWHLRRDIAGFDDVGSQLPGHMTEALIRTAEDLIVPVLEYDPSSIPAAVRMVLIRADLADPDSDVYNGVQYMSEITTAANRHGLGFALPKPSITAVSQNQGRAGSIVTITGEDFASQPANNTVRFNGTRARVVSAGQTSLDVEVPAGATRGRITVTTAWDTATSPADFIPLSFFAPPTITSLSRYSGSVGTAVSITGTNFSTDPARAGGGNTVKFNGTPAPVTAFTATRLDVTVPPGATNGPTTVETDLGTATSSDTFTVLLPAPSITGLSRTSGVEGTTVTISGANFLPMADGSYDVRFAGDLRVMPSPASATSLTVSIPEGAVSGRIRVTTPSGYADSPIFRVDFAVSQFKPSTDVFPGDTLTVIGGDFSGVTRVKIGSKTAASLNVLNNTRLTVMVATGTKTDQKITVYKGRTSAQSSQTLTLVPKPTVTGYSHTSIARGQELTVTGTSFMRVQEVKIGSLVVPLSTVTFVSSTELRFPIPNNAPVGKNKKVTVKNPSGVSSASKTKFTITN